MKQLTIHNLSIQMDMPDDANPVTYAKESLDLINLTLQREPYDLAAQVLTRHVDHIKNDLTVEEREDV